MHVIVSLYADKVNDEPFADLIGLLLRRTPCNVIIGRQQPDEAHPSPTGTYAVDEHAGA